MPHQRRPGPPRVVVDGIEGQDTLYEAELWTAPSRQWRAAFLRPPPSLITGDRTLEVGRVAIHGATLHFRTAPRHLGGWLRRIDKWIDYAMGWRRATTRVVAAAKFRANEAGGGTSMLASVG